MVIHTPAIVLKSFSYGESSIIAKCFSREQGKISFIIKGAKRSRSPKSVHFQPLSYVELVYNYQPKRDLQTISKVSFLEYWSKILSNLRSITLSMAILEITDKALSHQDPYPSLFSTLVDVLQEFDKDKINPNILFWFYECALLQNLGFKPDLEIRHFPGIVLPDIHRSKKTTSLLYTLLAGDIKKLPENEINYKDSKIISSYLWTLLRYHCENLNNVKFKKVIRDILN